MKAPKQNSRSGQWKGFLLVLVIGILLGGLGTAHSDDIVWEDQSSAGIYNQPGERLEDGESVDYHSTMKTTRVSGVEKAVLVNRSFTFIATGNDESKRHMTLRYFWDEGSSDPNKNQHSGNAEREILKSPGWDGPVFWTFKTCVFKDKLYLFFATEKLEDKGNGLADGVIYYMRADATAQGQPLRFEGKDQISEALGQKHRLSWEYKNHRRICATGVMNGTMYVIIAECTNPTSTTLPYQYLWYVVSTEDGEKWFTQSLWYYDTFPQSATTFMVSDPNNPSSPAYERMVLAGVDFNDTVPSQSRPFLRTFDGMNLSKKIYLPGNTQNILVSTGTVAGTVNDRQVIQIWCTETTEQHQKSILHGQYVPGGPGGDEGSLVVNGDGSMWKRIEQPGYWTARTDPWNGFNDPNVRFWIRQRALESWSAATVYGNYDAAGKQMQQYIDLTFFQKWVYWFCRGDRPYFKTLRYASDIMKADGDPKFLESWDPQYKDTYKHLWVLLGVIEGPPPIPENGHDIKELTEQFTRAVIGQSRTEAFVQTFTAQESFTVGFSGFAGSTPANPFGKGMGGTGIGGQFMQQRQKQESLTHSMERTVTIDYTSRSPSADKGQLVVMKPKIRNQRYKLYGYDGQYPLGLRYNALSITAARLAFEDYSLTNPDSLWYSKGMSPRFLTTDYIGWSRSQPLLQSPYYKGIAADGELEAGRGAGPSTIFLQKTNSTTETDSYGFHLGFDLSAFNVFLKILGIDVSFSMSMDWAFSNNTTLDNHVQWGISLPPIQGADSGVAKIRIQPYFLQAKSTDPQVWWTPEFFRNKGVQPWCITYQVTEFFKEQSGRTLAMEAEEGVSHLTLAVPHGGGSIRSEYLIGAVDASASFDVLSGDAIDLRAVPKRGYVFRKWVVPSSEIVQHGPLDDLQTWIVLKHPESMSTVQAVFDRVLPTVNVLLQDSDPAASHVDVSGCYLPGKLVEFKPAKDRLSVYINGYRLACDRKNGTWKKTPAGYIYSSKELGEYILALDFDTMTWSFYSKDTEIHRSMAGTGNSLKLGLELNGKRHGEKLDADIRYKFKTRRFSLADSAESDDSGFTASAPADQGAKAKAPFKVLKLRGSYDGAEPQKNGIIAEGKTGDIEGLNSRRLDRHGIVAFYVGDAALFKAKISDFIHNGEEGTYSFTDETHQMTIDLKNGTWSLEVTGSGTDVITDELVAAIMIIYDDSRNKPGMNVGLGEENLKIMWGGGDLLQTTRDAALTYKGQ